MPVYPRLLSFPFHTTKLTQLVVSLICSKILSAARRCCSKISLLPDAFNLGEMYLLIVPVNIFRSHGQEKNIFFCLIF